MSYDFGRSLDRWILVLILVAGFSMWPRLDPLGTFWGLKWPPFGESKGHLFFLSPMRSKMNSTNAEFNAFQTLLEPTFVKGILQLNFKHLWQKPHLLGVFSGIKRVHGEYRKYRIHKILRHSFIPKFPSKHLFRLSNLRTLAPQVLPRGGFRLHSNLPIPSWVTSHPETATLARWCRIVIQLCPSPVVVPNGPKTNSTKSWWEVAFFDSLKSNEVKNEREFVVFPWKKKSWFNQEIAL